MGCRHEKVLNIILLNGLHSLDALAAPVLGLEIIHRHALDIAKTGHGNYGIIPRNQILHIDIINVKSDLTSSVITVLFSSNHHFLFDHAKK